MSNKLYMRNVSIEGAGAIEGEDHYYRGIIQSTSLNTRYAFRAAMDTLRSIASQANSGVAVYAGHRYFNNPLGKSVSGTLYDEKVFSNFFITSGVQDTNSDDHIKRLDKGIVGDLSTGFMLTDQSKIKCDLCNGTFEQKYSWFNSYFEDAEGHILGQRIRSGENKGKRVTGELSGPVNLNEYSIVESGADPGAKIIKKIKENLQNGIFDEGILEYFAESMNLGFANLQNSLDVGTPRRRSFTGGTGMSDLLKAENERLSTENTEQAEQIETLESQVENMYSTEDYESMESEMKAKVETAETDRDKYKEEAEKNAVMANEGTIALEWARKEYKQAFISKCGNNPPTEEELENLDKSLESQTSFSELDSGIKRLRKEARENRSGGRKSRIQSAAKTQERPKPRGYAWA